MLYESLILLLPNCRFMVQLHPLAHAQFVGKAHRSETKFEKGASDRNSHPADEAMGVTLFRAANRCYGFLIVVYSHLLNNSGTIR